VKWLKQLDLTGHEPMKTQSNVRAGSGEAYFVRVDRDTVAG
jgi:hypothetical protein